MLTADQLKSNLLDAFKKEKDGLTVSKDDADNIVNFNKDYPISEGILKGVNFLEAGYQVGVNTVGQSLRNANRQIRSEPPNPQVSVSPWLNTTIGPDLARQPLEIGEDCYASINNNSL